MSAGRDDSYHAKAEASEQSSDHPSRWWNDREASASASLLRVRASPGCATSTAQRPGKAYAGGVTPSASDQCSGSDASA